SSTSRAGSLRSSPSSRASAKGSAVSLTEARTIFSARSRTSPASGPKISTIGRAGSGLATKASASAGLRAVMVAFLSLSPCGRGCRANGNVSEAGEGAALPLIATSTPHPAHCSQCSQLATLSHKGRGKRLGPRGEKGSQARADLVGDDLGGAGLGIAQAADAGEALHLAGDIVGHAGEGRSRRHGLAGRDLGQRVS